MRRAFGVCISVFSLVVLAACQQGGGPLRVDKVEPPQGTTAGGEEVTLVGGGFVPGKTQAEIRFGRRKVENVVIMSGSRIKVITPNGDKGPVDISVMFDEGSSFKIANGFRYLEPAAQDNARKAFFSGGSGEKKGPGVEVEKK